MTIDNTLSFYLLLACNGILVAAASIAILRLQRIIRTQKAFWASPNGMAVVDQTDTEALLDGLENRLSALLAGTANESKASARDTTNPKVIPFENAVRMARHGASLDDLTRTCGLSKTEARLLMRVHANTQQAAG